MISRIISNVIRFRLVVLILVLASVVASVYTVRIAPLDAIPDISDPQIVIYAKWPRSPQLLEAQVTEPLISALTGSSDIQSIRSTSHMGYSFIYVILNNGAQRARVQQLVLDRINTIRPQLPSDAVITLGPNASSIGWIYQYAIVDREPDQAGAAVRSRSCGSGFGGRFGKTIPIEDFPSAARECRHPSQAGHRRPSGCLSRGRRTHDRSYQSRLSIAWRNRQQGH